MSIALVEPAIVPDIYVSGRLAPEDLGNGDFRFTFYVKQKSLLGEEETNVIVARLIVPASVVIQNIPSTMKALGISCCGGARLRKLNH